MRQWYLQFRITVADGFGTAYCVRSNWLCATYTESRPMFVISLFVKVFLDKSSGRKSFRFPQVLIQILSPELNILPHSVSLLHTKQGVALTGRNTTGPGAVLPWSYN